MHQLTTNQLAKITFGFPEGVVNNNHKLYMASLDVESLFVNLPLEETITNCANDLFSNIFYSDKLTRKYSHDLLIY